MTDTPETAGAETVGGIDLYAGAYLLGFAIGTLTALPVVSALYFRGPLGSMHEAVAPFTPAVSSWWARAAFVAIALVGLLKTGQARGFQSAACFVGVAWLAQALLHGSAPGPQPLVSAGLSGLFGGLWMAASWALASPRQRRVGLAVVTLFFFAGIGAPILVTYLRLGAS